VTLCNHLADAQCLEVKMLPNLQYTMALNAPLILLNASSDDSTKKLRFLGKLRLVYLLILVLLLSELV